MNDVFADEFGSIREVVLHLQRQVYPTTPGTRRPLLNDRARALKDARTLADAFDEGSLRRPYELRDADDLDVARAHSIVLDLVQVLSSDITPIRAIDQARRLTQTFAKTLLSLLLCQAAEAG